ncbi:prolyl aminopeptidase Serine peptidase. MEROPS family S33 [Paraburkholderia caballeronis]|uniref:Proline iminopeptidase n=2 Tax=Paraburkholderia caballeronis TaxID=416943 RepID=A0A1H7LL48_9BURK|nr:prolyl aminopeptidase [Paraburkholderia caballeronis]PXX03875.1 prolyl aminopeptidase [Paraburkholderia caballeronis]RAK04619.1 prolyl aminopeptidase [Paraburkholderia caballeronis]SED72513.1 prolyl aminopeptidase Serine peptidase. MEROPS family S33 [Paraburkholderia caballeronis]SEK99680.1 prolyl aminopeptidase Serine peptidase. MEROPS family S33 [Paraburkholderia caballeronis]
MSARDAVAGIERRRGARGTAHASSRRAHRAAANAATIDGSRSVASVGSPQDRPSPATDFTQPSMNQSRHGAASPPDVRSQSQSHEQEAPTQPAIATPSQHPHRMTAPRFSLLRTRDGHRIAYAVAGAADGVPVVALHGGPGSGSQPSTARLFDLARVRVVLIDQRGAGVSRPHGSVRRNDTARLIDDIETVRRHLGIARWGVLGGSWGASLALAYAGRHPEAVTGVVLRGLFLTSAREVSGLFVASRRRAPREWLRLRRAAGCETGTRPAALLSRCQAALQRGANGATQRAVALAWRDYENAVLASARPGRAGGRTTRTSRRRADKLAGKYRVQAFYLRHRCWLGEPRLLTLARRAAAAGVPLVALHGRRDPVCPPANLGRLARSVPSARVEYIANAGHLATDPRLRKPLMRSLATMFVTEARGQ